MADRVIVVGVRRGGQLIPASELKQMMGRAGRDHEGTGIVEVVVDDKDIGVVSEMLEDGATTVTSSLANHELLAMSLMPEIHRGNVSDMDSAKAWCSRSLCPDVPLSKALELLVEVEAVKEENGRLEATIVGACASRYYFHPADVFAWHQNFSNLFELGLENDEVASAWAMGNVPYDRVVGDLGDRRYLASECQALMPFGLSTMKGSLINVVAWWYLIGGPSPGTIRPACLERRKNFGRFKSALVMLNKYCGWKMDDYFEELELRVKKGLPTHLVPLCKFAGMTKGRADYLYSLGVKSGKDFVGIGNQLDEDIDDDFKETIERVARQFG